MEYNQIGIDLQERRTQRRAKRTRSAHLQIDRRDCLRLTMAFSGVTKSQQITSKAAERPRIMLRFPNTNRCQHKSLLDLPMEIRLRVYEIVTRGFHAGFEYEFECSRRSFVDPILDRPPYFAPANIEDRCTAISLLLVNKQVHNEFKTWIYSQRRLDFINPSSIWNLREALGSETFGMVRRIEICSSWGSSDNPCSIKRLQKLAGVLTGIRSLGLLWFKRGVWLYPGRQTSEEWTEAQISTMVAIKRAFPNLPRLYHRCKYEQLRLCAENLRMLSCETEVVIDHTVVNE